MSILSSITMGLFYLLILLVCFIGFAIIIGTGKENELRYEKVCERLLGPIFVLTVACFILSIVTSIGWMLIILLIALFVIPFILGE